MTSHQPKLLEFPGGSSNVTLMPPFESFTFDDAGNARLFCHSYGTVFRYQCGRVEGSHDIERINDRYSTDHAVADATRTIFVCNSPWWLNPHGYTSWAIRDMKEEATAQNPASNAQPAGRVQS